MALTNTQMKIHGWINKAFQFEIFNSPVRNSGAGKVLICKRKLLPLDPCKLYDVTLTIKSVSLGSRLRIKFELLNEVL